MEWDECLKTDVMPAAKNRETARALLKLCEARLEVARGIDGKKFPALVGEAYYEIVKELITALLAAKGFKSYSHVCLIGFIRKFYHAKFSGHEIELMDTLRRIRNDLEYRGVLTGADFMERNEGQILGIISRLKEEVKAEAG